ncbi:maleylpyruvate isomerase N-terminal domain-containing protein [Streptomyces sp. NBC_00878]|uniref:maleylpyruvate isomerase N-terminal domain-containing protein n=1 Tax=Streptomyces sp. NBC_00878 TaxID=2975854 RepID=UPI002259156B|nr:maleylpyruvate isomerase N-terminal domain-containing protein [Streptomyces sp. NBC_00878]MCX4908977.1 maleylpyruvate isomerase N-terminal domain-containing protein [Streptomyces sp. NBC_00878]
MTGAEAGAGAAPLRELRWTAQGHQYFMSCLKLIDDCRLEGPSALPGWSGRHLLSHVGHNARALARLAHWAATGEPTPMYPSPSARAEEIDTGARWPVPRLRDFVEEEQDRLVAELDRIIDERWQADVVTAQGRTVPASTIPWLRSRELWIHACDLPSAGDLRSSCDPPSSCGDFAAMPDDFVDALISDALTRRRTVHSCDLRVRATDRDTGREQTGPVRTGPVPTGREQTGPVQTGPVRTGRAETYAAETYVQGSAADLARWLTGRGASPRLRTAAGELPELPPWL